MSLKGKTAVITGSSSGIGKAIALLFAKMGANLVLCSNTSEERGREVASSAKRYGVDSIYVSADLRDESSVKNLFNITKDIYGSIDILINNAGRTYNVPFYDINEESFINDIKTNLLSAVFCSKYAIKLMTNESGWIINTSSIRGVDYSGRPGIIGYCSAKTGINSFTKTLASELAPHIFVNAVAPGFVATGYMDTMDEDTKTKWLDNIPIHRFIEPDEVAEVYLMLATSKIFSGSVIVPDGGYSLLGR